MEVAAFEDICYLPLLLPYLMSDSNRDATSKDVKDDKTFLLTSDLYFRDDFSPRTYFGLSYTILISSSYTILIITLFDHPWIS